MKLQTLYESTDMFQNIEHTSQDDRMKVTNIKIASLKKEVYQIEQLLHQLPITPDIESKRTALKQKLKTAEDRLSAAKNTKLTITDPDSFTLLDQHKAEAAKNGFSATIPNPTKLAMFHGGKAGTDNPALYSAAHKRFAGRPWDFSWWTSKRLQEYKAFSDLLKRNGKNGFTKMYAGMYHGQYLNFVMIGDDGNFVWRVYDQGGGSGQNWLYINGKKTNASSFDYRDTKTQDIAYHKLYNNV